MRPSRLLVAAALSMLSACGDGTEPPTIASVAFSTDAVTMIVDDALSMIALVTDSRGSPMSNVTVTYASSDQSVATVSAQGSVQALATGTTTITATASGLTDQLQVTVVLPTVKKVELTIAIDSVLTDESLGLVAVVTDARDKVVRYPLTYSSSANDVVSVSATGVVKGVRTGVSTITVTADTAHDTAELRVRPYFTEIAAGGTHTCGITPKGVTYCWGTDALGTTNSPPCQFASSRCSALPVQVQTSQRFMKIAAGGIHTCALTETGAAYCWGINHDGELGNGTTTAALTPTAVAGGHTFSSIAAGRFNTCGIVTSGDTYCWGTDYQGQIGAGQTAPDRCTGRGTNGPCARTPTKVAGGFSFVDVKLSDRAVCGRTSLGAVYCWGLEVGGTDPTDCQGSNTDSPICTRTPLLQVGGRSYAKFGMGDVHKCGHLAVGTLECWGANYWGMFGNGTDASSETPVTAAGGMSFAKVISLRVSMCGLTTGNAAYCWGSNAVSQIGDGSAAESRLSPAAVAGGLAFTDIMAGSEASQACGVSTTGRAYCWGAGTFGQLGTGAFASSNVPVLVKLFP